MVKDLKNWLLNNNFEYELKKYKHDIYIIDLELLYKNNTCIVIETNLNLNTICYNLYINWSFFMQQGELLLKDAGPNEIIRYLQENHIV